MTFSVFNMTLKSAIEHFLFICSYGRTPCYVWRGGRGDPVEDVRSDIRDSGSPGVWNLPLQATEEEEEEKEGGKENTKSQWYDVYHPYWSCKSPVSEVLHTCLTELCSTEADGNKEDMLEATTGDGTEQMPSKTTTETRSKKQELLVLISWLFSFLLTCL